MDLNKLIQMVLNIVLRRAVNFGVNKGIDMVAGKGKAAAEMSPEEREAAARTRAAVKRARQAAKITRKL